MSSYIFIAFASADKTTGERVTRMFENSGQRCWVFPRDVMPGMAWGDAVVDAIVSAKLVMILASAAGNESTELTQIVEAAFRLSPSAHVPIIAFRIDSVPIDRGVGRLIHNHGIIQPSLPDDVPGFLELIQEDLRPLLSGPQRLSSSFGMTDRPDETEIDIHRIEGRSSSGGAPMSSPMPPPSEPPGAGASPAQRPAPTPRRAPIESAQIDPVEFGVAHPVRIARDKPFTLGVWLFKREDRNEAEDRALAAQGKNAQFLSQGSVAIARGTAITVTLQIEGWRIEPDAQTVLWTGDITNVAFLARPLPASDRFGHGMTCIGDGKIIVNGIRVAQIFFNLALTANPAAELAMATGSLFKTAFASYARHDRRRVLGRVQGIEKLGVKVFMDVHDLKPGAAYNQELFDTIDRSDVLYLFWSRRARESAYVEREWLRAGERGMAFIDPVPLVDPRKVPPPAELAGEKHFADWTLAFIEYEKSASLLDRLRAWIAGD